MEYKTETYCSDTDWKEKIIEYIEGTKDFLLENAPSFFQEIVAYGRAKSLFCLVILPLIFIGGIVSSVRAFRIRSFGEYGDVIPGTGGYIVLRIVGLGLAFFSFVMFAVLIDDAILCWFAPKLYILRKIKG